MTYDDWKLETPEDEARRRYGRGRFLCSQCGTVNGDDLNCRNCDALLHTEDEIEEERDPDDARDERMDREMER